MVHVLRLIVALFALVAATAASATDYYWAVSGNTAATTAPTPDASCRLYSKIITTSYTYDHAAFVSATKYNCVFVSPTNGATSIPNYAQRGGDACPTGTTLNATTGLCDAPPPPTCPSAGSSAGSSGSEYITQSLSTHICIGGCTADASGGMYAGGNYRAFGPFRFDGTSCTGSNSPAGDSAPHAPSDNAPGSCPPGTTNIGQDSAGTPICAGKPPTDAPKPPTTTSTTPKVSNPDGSTSQTTTTTSTNSDGSTTTTTTTTTTGADGSTSSSTSTTVGNTPTGAPGHSDSKSDDKGDLCRMHPELNICKNSSVAGACENTTCTGDAIQCEILRQDRQAYCDAIKENDLQGVGVKAISGDMTGLPNVSGASQIAVGQVSATSFLGGGSCFQDKTVSFRGQSFTLPLSKACDALIALRYIVMITALLAAYRMLSGTILRA